MGKNHRHKKDLKADKAKVKLKQSKTKFLPKGQNVTNTSFKIKPIVLPEQLKQKHSEDILSKRKLNVKDLLSRIKHYNENVRHSACEELTDMVKVHTEEIIQQYLSQICLVISSLMQDRERKVRKSAVKCIDSILQYIPGEKLVPFFDFFSTNLRCAMTNIDKNIQEDSLNFLDSFLTRDCGLVNKTSEKLLPDFLSLISKLRNDSQLGRTLTLNLGSKMTSVAWRIKVLSRLHSVLSVILVKADNKNIFEGSATSNLLFDASQNQTVPLYKDIFGKRLDQLTFDISSTKESIAYNKELDTVNKHIIALVPLLYETWLEVMPDQKVQKSDFENTVLNEETAALLTCVMNTLYLLWQYVKQVETEDLNLKTVFMSNEGRKFLMHLLTHFPYSQPGGRTKKLISSLKTLENNTDPKCIHENLLVCFMYSVLYVNCTQHNLKKEMSTIVSYITKLLFQKRSLGEENIQCIIELLRECLSKKDYQKWQRSGMDLQMILENTIMFYDHGKLKNDKKLQVFRTISSVIDNDFLSRSTVYQNWLSGLPNILCQEDITDTAILALLELSKKNCSKFHIALVKKLPDILDNLYQARIVVSNESLIENEEAAKRNLVNIFYYVPRYSQADLDIFQTFIRRTTSSFKLYLQQVLSLSWNTKRESEEFSKFLGFKNAHILKEKQFYKTMRGPGTNDTNEELYRKKSASIYQDVGLGSGKRFDKGYTEVQVPPPDTYFRKISQSMEQRKKTFSKLPTFEWDGFVDRFKPQGKSYHLAPNRYEPDDQKNVADITRKAVSLRGPYDCFTGPRDGSTIKNHFTPQLTRGPDYFYVKPSDSDYITQHHSKKRYGLFLKGDRFQKIPTIRSMLNDLSLCYKDPNAPGPASYNLKTSSIARLPDSIHPFNSSNVNARPPIDWRISPGPGRYTPKQPKCVKGKRSSWVFLSKQDRNLIKVQQYTIF